MTAADASFFVGTTIGKKTNDERSGGTKDERWKSLAQRRRLHRMSLYHFTI
jgi:hypothetical protein